MNTIRIQFKEFDGPLDVLLKLIEEKQMEISDVSISAVTERYLAYMDTMVETDAHELADFLVIAAKLLLHKSRLLLPQLVPDDEDGLSIEDQLLQYRTFIRVSRHLESLWMDANIGYERIEPPILPTEFRPPENLSLQSLRDSMVQLAMRLLPPKPLSETHIDKTISLKEKIDILRKLLLRDKEVRFDELLSESRSRTEIIVNFLAILELVKQKDVYLSQHTSFSDITISLS